MAHSFVLASQSPRRRRLLGLLGAPILIEVSGANEDIAPDQDPIDYVSVVAQRKAEIVAALPHAAPGGRVLIIAADTTVVVDDIILGKPTSAEDARSMLRLLRNRPHLVHTGLCVIDPISGRQLTEAHTARVFMRDYADNEIEAYIATGDPLDKAGAYGIQHPTFRPVARLDGCFLGVMGLSLCHLVDVLRRLDAPSAVNMTMLREVHEGYACRLLSGLAIESR